MSNLINRIQAFNKGRDEQQLKRKYRLMGKSPFAFMRATCHLFYEDWPKKSALNTAPVVWIAGDLHLQNIAAYQGADSLVYLDINDFDDSLLAPCVWDVARFLSSLHIAFGDDMPKTLPEHYVTAYAKALGKNKVQSIQGSKAPQSVRDWLDDCAQNKRIKLLNEYSVQVEEKRKLMVIQDETYVLNEAEHQRAVRLLSNWSATQLDAKRYQLIDVMGHIGGLSSIGLERYLLLVEGEGLPSNNALLEIKQRIHSALTPYAPPQQTHWANPAVRVVALQKRLQAVPPSPLEAINHETTYYTIREIQPAQEKISLNRFNQARERQALIETLGKLTAWAHLRGAGQQGAASTDQLITFANKSAWQNDVLAYASDYAEHILSNFKTFSKSDLGKAD